MAVLFCILPLLNSCLAGCTNDPDAGKYSKTVTFVSPEPAPQGFDTWTFQWSTPRWDGKAKLDYIVRLPNGTTYFEGEVTPTEAWNPATDGLVTFGTNDGGGDPSPFFGKPIKITFRVEKGSLIFSPDRFYTFKYYQGGVEGSLLATQAAVMESE